MASSAFGAFLGGLGGGAVGSAVVKLYLDASQYQSGMTQAKGETAAASAQMSGQASNFSKAWTIGGAVAAAAIGKFAIDSVRAAVESQEAQDKLKNSIENTGHAADFSVKAFNDQAAALRDTTGASDEAINGVQGLLVQMGYTQDQVIQLTPYINDLSAKMGIDLASAAKAVGKAAEGSTGALARYLGPIEEGTNKAGTYANVLEKLGGVAGYAATQAKAEPWKILAQQFDELQESVGAALLPAIQELTPRLTELTRDVAPILSAAVKTAVDEMGPFIDALDAAGKLIDEVVQLIPQLSQGTQDQGAAADSASKSTSGWTSAIDFLKQTNPITWIGKYNDFIFKHIGLLKESSDATVTNTEIVHNYTLEQKEAAARVQNWGMALLRVNHVLPPETANVKDDTAAIKASNQALQEQINLRWKVAGGILGVVDAYRQLKQDQATVNRLEREGKTNTAAYRDAVRQLIGDQIDYRQQIQGVRQDLRQGNITVGEAKKQLEDFGRQAGLSKDHVRDFLDKAIGPFIDKMRVAKGATDDLTNAINNIPRNRNISITVHTRYTGQAQPV